MNFIDAHSHVWTDDTAHYPLGAGWKKEDMKPARFTPEDLFKHTKANGVDRVNLIQMSYYYPKERRPVGEKSDHTGGFDNKYMLDMIALYPDTFVGTAVIDPLGDDPANEMTQMRRQQVRAFRIHPSLSKQPAEKWLEPPGYMKMFDAAARNNQAMSCLIGPDALPELDRMCRKFPDTPIIIDHLCRIGTDGTIRDADVDALCALARHDRVMIKVGAFYALGKKAAPYTDLAGLIEKVVKAFTAKRCMWESDCPFQVSDGHKYADSINLVKTGLKFLSADQRDYLLRRTAEEFFFKK
jgi:predicted TIM-barrel fold metal-dependent hydrolase